MAKPTWFELITLLAILVGPIFALLAQRALDRIRENKERRARLYVTLMTTRGAPLGPDHVNALNSIDVVFNGARDEKIRNQWHRLLTHVSADTTRADWQEKFNDLKVDLLREIGVQVGYTFTTDQLKREVYLPRFQADLMQDFLQIRTALKNALTDGGLKVKIQPSEEPPSDSPPR